MYRPSTQCYNANKYCVYFDVAEESTLEGFFRKKHTQTHHMIQKNDDSNIQ